jgi:enamine deaminase RidA (YjgF/YER057c/UK114 family)
MSLSQKLATFGVTLPTPAGPFGAYVPVKRTGNLLYVSGQLPMQDGKLIARGQVVSRCSIEQAKLGARQCVINALGAIQAAEGTVDKLTGVLRVGAFVNSDASFTQQPAVANGASEFLIELFGDSGRHVRAAVGVNTLPLDAAVEVEFVFVTE